MIQSFIRTPQSISFNDIANKDFTLSSSQYMDVIIPNPNLIEVRDFLDRKLTRKDLGVEVGSLSYIQKSTHYFMRTKALQSHSFLPDISSESVLPILPRTFVNMNLKEGDLIISKDSNIGEIVILDKDYPNIMLSGAIYKLPVSKNKLYLLAMIKHRLFREQLDLLVPKGATIRHAKTLFLDCKIPMPNRNTEDAVKFIEMLMQAIINKEKLIRAKHEKILSLIEVELSNNQKAVKFDYKHPNIEDLNAHNRLDATFHGIKHKSLIYPTLNYINGYAALTDQGFELKPGPSLEIKIIEKRIDSDFYIDGFYKLITPKQILNYGITNIDRFIGTPKTIPTMKYGDVLFGESGTGRTMVFLEHDDITINNAHAHILRPLEDKCSLEKAICIRSVMQYYKEIGLIDCLTVGGNGGHLSPSYFNRVYIPNFPEKKQKEISILYHNPEAEYQKELTLENFLDQDEKFNASAGIYELDKTVKRLKEILDSSLEDIANDIDVQIRF
jgi:type I restriction enzyme S subunit